MSSIEGPSNRIADSAADDWMKFRYAAPVSRSVIPYSSSIRVVMKFGGTSVGIASNFAQAQGIVLARVARDAAPPIVVVSALTGVTNLLVEYGAMPSRRKAIAARIVERHEGFATETAVGRE